MTTLCYRNSFPLYSREGVEVEAGCLWRFSEFNGLLVLVDEDEYITADFSSEMFYIAD